MKDWAYWAIAASRTWKITRPPGRGLAAMWFSSDRAALAPQCDFRTIRLRQIVRKSHRGASAARSLENHIAAKPRPALSLIHI